MTFSSLPVECVCSIINELEDDRSTLYKCLFVNRFWCKTVAPLLWKQPFEQNFEGINKIRTEIVIQSYIISFNEDEQRLLIPFNVRFSSEFKRPLFDYAIFLRFYDIDQIKNAVERWIKFSQEPEKKKVAEQENNNMKRIERILRGDYGITRAMTKMIMRLCKNLRTLRLYPSEVNQGFPFYQMFVNANPGLTRLRALHVRFLNHPDYDQDAFELFQHLPKLCTNLVELDIHFNGYQPNGSIYVDTLTNLIKNQKNLEILGLFNSGKISPKLFSALKSQKDNLINLMLFCLDFDFIIMEEYFDFTNLQELHIKWCSKMTLQHAKYLINSRFHINALLLVENNISSEVISWILAKAGDHLKYLVFDHITEEIIKTLVKKCPNLNSLSITVSKDNYQLIFPWLTQTNLNQLIFNISEELDTVNDGNLLYYNTRKPDASKVISHLAFNLPNSLKYLRINCRFNSESLKDLLINSMNYYLKILIIEPFDEFNSDHLNTLADYFVEYFEENKLKILGIPSLFTKNEVMFKDVILYMLIEQHVSVFDSDEL
ncbi:hypothetical protein C1645_730965 [Glomus cerebriforme]|uniref:F-box domain-containing protein n=1 Tax=Glomus cerebriforme TaxID=658196 RepID=A0A397TMB6_9GLOM|nr:hypothetical protein C1645_730965 [Glomus cerebriforme]